MKKVLIATTALVMTAGVAAAESHLGVKVSGTARMGVYYDGSNAQFSSRVRIIFTASGETDGGLSFGAEVRNDQSGVGNSANGDSTVYIKGAFGKLTMGDTGNAADSLVGQTSGVGYGPIDGLHEIGFLGRDNTGAYYEYSSGALTFGVGAGQTIDPSTPATPANDDFISAAVKYAGTNFSVALGYEDNATDSAVSALGSATFGAATVKAKLYDQDTNTDLQFSVSVDYKISGATVTAFYTDFGATDVQHAGIGASYDLGGGATLAGGIVQQMNPASVPTGDATFADFGLKFAF